MIVLLLILSALTGSACREVPSSPPLPVTETPIPESKTKQIIKKSTHSTVLTVEQMRKQLKQPQLQRYANPGSLRWVMDFDAPVTYIRWSPLKGFVVTVGNQVHNVTSRGENRWRVVGGDGHQLFWFNDIELMFSPAFRQISQLRRRGLSGWKRDWNGQVVSSGDRVYLFDASTVSELREDGRDKWRVSLAGVRKLDGPFPCEQGMLVHGISGLKSIAAEITVRGSLAKTTALGRGALLLNAGTHCEPIVWREGQLMMLDSRGNRLFSKPYKIAPFVHRLEQGFAVISGRAGLPARYEVIGENGKTIKSSDLPVAGRLTTVDASNDGFAVQALGVCLDVTAPCAKPKGNRGPYNAVLTIDRKGTFRTLIRHTAGHLNFARHPEGGHIIASSKGPESVDLIRRDANQNVIWQMTLPGRLSAGPIIGPYGGVYLGTCHSWDCIAPYRLFAITATEPEPESDD